MQFRAALRTELWRGCQGVFRESFGGGKAREEAVLTLQQNLSRRPRIPSAPVARGGGELEADALDTLESEVKLRCHTTNASPGMQALGVFLYPGAPGFLVAPIHPGFAVP